MNTMQKAMLESPNITRPNRHPEYACSVNLVFGLPIGWIHNKGYNYTTRASERTLLCPRGHIIAGTNAKPAGWKANGTPKGARCRLCQTAKSRNGEFLANVEQLEYEQAQTAEEIIAEAEAWDAIEEQLAYNRKQLKRKQRPTVAESIAKRRESMRGRSLADIRPDVAARTVVHDPTLITGVTVKDYKVPVICDEHPGVAFAQQIRRRDGRPNPLAHDCNICGMRVLVPTINSVAVRYPEVASRIIVWDPWKITDARRLVVPIICDAHPHVAVMGNIYNATRRPDACGICANYQLGVGYNDFATRFPLLLPYWDDPRDPATVCSGGTPDGRDSGVQYKCPKCERSIRFDAARYERMFLDGEIICRHGIGYDVTCETGGSVYVSFDAFTNLQPDTKLLSFGITTQAPEDRFAQHFDDGLIIGDAPQVLHHENAAIAKLIESSIKRATRLMRMQAGAYKARRDRDVSNPSNWRRETESVVNSWEIRYNFREVPYYNYLGHKRYRTEYDTRPVADIYEVLEIGQVIAEHQDHNIDAAITETDTMSCYFDGPEDDYDLYPPMMLIND